MRGNRAHGLLALGGIALATLLAVIGHLEVNDNLNPWSLTVSDFAVSDRGGVVDAAMAVLAAATAVLVPALWRAGAQPGGSGAAGRRPARAHRAATALLLIWAAGLVIAAVVPTNEPGTSMDTAAYLHRYASVVAFLAVPVAGWLLAGHLPGRAGNSLRALAATSLLLAGTMAWSAYSGDRLLIGLVERLLILAEVTLLAVVAASVARRHRPAGQADHSSSWSMSWRAASVIEPERLG
ncbi:DUF998 domain-containing protein [Micromonospora sp. KC723]|uniref:DUF998 domain-containing protein n=1 Tax=Micromonospora sp. KC723 TaxID=2530381 RepID=UPI00104CBD94|nr:DUF998 domain-containing protein [Micromonospora sp. KC723]TDB75729.1 DUF998 domain-containing protein [Micromonospora sp. KC723]